MTTELQMWTIYDHPRDVPNAYVARMHVVEAGATHPADVAMISNDVEKIREFMKRLGKIKLMRDPRDDPVILETWI